jgi:hypothetical protein
MTTRSSSLITLLAYLLISSPLLVPSAAAEEYRYTVPRSEVGGPRDITVTVSGNTVRYQSVALATWTMTGQLVPASILTHDYTFELSDVDQQNCAHKTRYGISIIGFKLRNGPLVPATVDHGTLREQAPGQWWDIPVDSDDRGNQIFNLLCRPKTSAQNQRNTRREAQQGVRATCPDGSPIPANGVCPTLVYPSKAEREAQERAKKETARKAAEEERRRQEAARRAAEEEQRRQDIAMQDQFQKLQNALSSPSQGRSGLNVSAPTLKAVDDDIDEDIGKRRTLGDWVHTASSPASRLYVSTILRSLWNAVPVIGVFVWEKKSVDELGRMLDAVRGEVKQ